MALPRPVDVGEGTPELFLTLRRCVRVYRTVIRAFTPALRDPSRPSRIPRDVEVGSMDGLDLQSIP